MEETLSFIGLFVFMFSLLISWSDNHLSLQPQIPGGNVHGLLYWFINGRISKWWNKMFAVRYWTHIEYEIAAHVLHYLWSVLYSSLHLFHGNTKYWYWLLDFQQSNDDFFFLIRIDNSYSGCKCIVWRVASLWLLVTDKVIVLWEDRHLGETEVDHWHQSKSLPSIPNE